MPPASDRELKKVTMNFYRDDVAYMVSVYGTGWTGEIRERLSDFVKERKQMAKQINNGFTTEKRT